MKKKIPTINEWSRNSELVGLGVVGSWGNRVIDGTGAVTARRAGHLLVQIISEGIYNRHMTMWVTMWTT